RYLICSFEIVLGNFASMSRFSFNVLVFLFLYNVTLTHQTHLISPKLSKSDEFSQEVDVENGNYQLEDLLEDLHGSKDSASAEYNIWKHSPLLSPVSTDSFISCSSDNSIEEEASIVRNAVNEDSDDETIIVDIEDSNGLEDIYKNLRRKPEPNQLSIPKIINRPIQKKNSNKYFLRERKRKESKKIVKPRVGIFSRSSNEI
ncbi:hypothetical protein ROZALSC1DRAFT_31167, partial [Rozella allomycis CSF55]